MSSETLDRVAAIGRFPDQSHIGLSLEYGGNAFPDQRMIIDAKDTDRIQVTRNAHFPRSVTASLEGLLRGVRLIDLAGNHQ
jgi:hypothetical protein